ncbi:hypothetical protein ASF89_00690 [Frigoribacterium sp. Leaf172]|nr:hypothetical protein ASF89_00690 [Frigoribacterium sp. Leaf172]
MAVVEPEAGGVAVFSLDVEPERSEGRKHLLRHLVDRGSRRPVQTLIGSQGLDPLQEELFGQA